MDRFAHVNGIVLHYLDHPGGEPLMVLMPGLTATAHSFGGLIAAGLSPRFRVLAPDLRGRGQSGKPPTGYSMADHAADVLGLLDSLHLDTVVLGGHSFGALLAIYMAAHHPQRVSHLVIIDAAASLHPRTRELIQPSLDRLVKVVPSPDAYIDAMKQLPYLRGWWDPMIERFYRSELRINPNGTAQCLTSPDAVAQAVDAALSEPWGAHVARVRQPAILLNALGPFGPPGVPPILPREQAMETVQALASCRYAEIPGNHMTMIFGENAKQAVAAIAAFVNA